MGNIDDDLVVQARLLAEPCVWYWEIRDGVDGRLVESSWANDWVAFASQLGAAGAGAIRLGELRRTGSSARLSASPGRPGPRMVTTPARRAG